MARRANQKAATWIYRAFAATRFNLRSGRIKAVYFTRASALAESIVLLKIKRERLKLGRGGVALGSLHLVGCEGESGEW